MTKASVPSPQGRGPADHEVRDQIVVAATAHFRLYGYEKTTVSDLAKAIGFSKAYIYKFFESKQAIGEAICSRCLHDVTSSVEAAIAEVASPPEKLRRMFKSVVEISLRLFFDERRLHEIAASSAAERWDSARAYEQRLRKMLEDILRLGRATGDFERKTPMDESVAAIYLVLRAYTNPLLLQHSLDFTEDAPTKLSDLVLRSLAP